MEALRDRIMRGVGTDEPWYLEQGAISVNWRKPLRLDEIEQMAPTPEVRQREGRP